MGSCLCSDGPAAGADASGERSAAQNQWFRTTRHSALQWEQHLAKRHVFLITPFSATFWTAPTLSAQLPTLMRLRLLRAVASCRTRQCQIQEVTTWETRSQRVDTWTVVATYKSQEDFSSLSGMTSRPLPVIQMTMGSCLCSDGPFNVHFLAAGHPVLCQSLRRPRVSTTRTSRSQDVETRQLRTPGMGMPLVQSHLSEVVT